MYPHISCILWVYGVAELYTLLVTYMYIICMFVYILYVWARVDSLSSVASGSSTLVSNYRVERLERKMDRVFLEYFLLAIFALSHYLSTTSEVN